MHWRRSPPQQQHQEKHHWERYVPRRSNNFVDAKLGFARGNICSCFTSLCREEAEYLIVGTFGVSFLSPKHWWSSKAREQPRKQNSIRDWWSLWFDSTLTAWHAWPSSDLWSLGFDPSLTTWASWRFSLLAMACFVVTMHRNQVLLLVLM